MAATLRPETMAGQTNCWVLPEGEYGAYRGLNGEIFVLTGRSARNLAFQDKTPNPGQAELLLPLKGQDLIGIPLKVRPSFPSVRDRDLHCQMTYLGSFRQKVASRRSALGLITSLQICFLIVCWS